MPSITETLVEWAWSLRIDDVPHHVSEAARRHLLDGVGCAVAGYRTGTAPFATVFTGTRGPSTVLASGIRAEPGAAAFANGVLLHALDFDDTHAEGLVHATASVLPALFSVGEDAGVGGPEIVATAVAGYETVCRIGRAVRHGFHTRGFHATSVCGIFAAALVAARLRRLTPETAVAALGIAGSFASGSLEFLHTGSATKQLHPGWAARAGIAAVALAAAGADGPSTILEGGYGIYRAFTGRDVAPAAVTSGLGEEWETTRITIKPYPICQLSHASIDALDAVRHRLASPDEIGSIEVVLPEESVPVVAEPRQPKLDPRTPYEAKFSLPWDLAALLVDGGIGVDTFAPERLDRPDVRRLADRIRVVGYSAETAAADAPGRLTVTLTNGETITSEVPRSAGGPDAPLSDGDLIDKFSSNCGTGIRDPEDLARRFLHLEEEDDLSSLLAATALGTPGTEPSATLATDQATRSR